MGLQTYIWIVDQGPTSTRLSTTVDKTIHCHEQPLRYRSEFFGICEATYELYRSPMATVDICYNSVVAEPLCRIGHERICPICEDYNNFCEHVGETIYRQVTISNRYSDTYNGFDSTMIQAAIVYKIANFLYDNNLRYFIGEETSDNVWDQDDLYHGLSALIGKTVVVDELLELLNEYIPDVVALPVIMTSLSEQLFGERGSL